MKSIKNSINHTCQAASINKNFSHKNIYQNKLQKTDTWCASFFFTTTVVHCSLGIIDADRNSYY